MYKPDFPTHNYLELQRSKIKVGDSRTLVYETDYQDNYRKRNREGSKQEIDTAMLQKTHWTTGNIGTTKTSEMHDSYRPCTANAVRDPALSRDQLMRTTFVLGDPNQPFAQRQAGPNGPVEPVKYMNYREKFTATHFDLTNPSAPKWQTTNQESFRPYTAKPAESAQIELNRGYGAKSCFEQYGAFATSESDYGRSFKNPGRPQTAQPSSVAVNGNNIVFTQGTTQKWQRTNHRMKGPQMDYSTTTQDSFCKDRSQLEVIDPKYAKMKRAQLTKSSVSQASSAIPPVTESVSHSAIKPHPECRPPPLAEATAYKSHMNYKGDNVPFRTTMQDAYYPKKAESIPPADMALQRSHIQMQYDGLGEKRSLYQDTFTKPPETIDRVDADACRAFHMGHHSKTDMGAAKNTGKTTYEDSWRANPGFKPPPSCDALKGGHNIVPNEERFNVKESNYTENFKRPGKCEQATVTDNMLQKSHLQLKSAQDPWTTTQQDYFRYKTYRMPGDLI